MPLLPWLLGAAFAIAAFRGAVRLARSIRQSDEDAARVLRIQREYSVPDGGGGRIEGAPGDAEGRAGHGEHLRPRGEAMNDKPQTFMDRLADHVIAEMPSRQDGSYDQEVVRSPILTLLERAADAAMPFQMSARTWRFVALIEAAAIFGWWLAQ